jgi:hypothetical protein
MVIAKIPKKINIHVLFALLTTSITDWSDFFKLKKHPNVIRMFFWPRCCLANRGSRYTKSDGGPPDLAPGGRGW